MKIAPGETRGNRAPVSPPSRRAGVKSAWNCYVSAQGGKRGFQPSHSAEIIITGLISGGSRPHPFSALNRKRGEVDLELICKVLMFHVELFWE